MWVLPNDFTGPEFLEDEASQVHTSYKRHQVRLLDVTVKSRRRNGKSRGEKRAICLNRDGFDVLQLIYANPRPNTFVWRCCTESYAVLTEEYAGMNELDTSVDRFVALEGTDELHFEDCRRNRPDKLSRSLLRNPEGKKELLR